jgi:hypothetical protein
MLEKGNSGSFGMVGLKVEDGIFGVRRFLHSDMVSLQQAGGT